MNLVIDIGWLNVFIFQYSQNFMWSAVLTLSGQIPKTNFSESIIFQEKSFVVFSGASHCPKFKQTKNA